MSKKIVKKLLSKKSKTVRLDKKTVVDLFKKTGSETGIIRALKELDSFDPLKKGKKRTYRKQKMLGDIRHYLGLHKKASSFIYTPKKFRKIDKKTGAEFLGRVEHRTAESEHLIYLVKYKYQIANLIKKHEKEYGYGWVEVSGQDEKNNEIIRRSNMLKMRDFKTHYKEQLDGLKEKKTHYGMTAKKMYIKLILVKK